MTQADMPHLRICPQSLAADAYHPDSYARDTRSYPISDPNTIPVNGRVAERGDKAEPTPTLRKAA